MSLRLTGRRQQENQQAATNLVFVDEHSFNDLYTSAGGAARVDTATVRCEIGGYVFNVRADPRLPDNSVACNGAARTCARVPLDKEVQVRLWNKPVAPRADAVTFTLTPIKTVGASVTVKATALTDWIRRTLTNQVVTLNQQLFLVDESARLTLVGHVAKIEDAATASAGGGISSASNLLGLLTDATEFNFESHNPAIMVEQSGNSTLFKAEFNFEALGIGGLDREFQAIFRRAFASRVYSPALIQELGITHVKGILLYGPPGTGKTLIARQIGKALRAKEPKIVNGPEVLNKYVGQSEENIRNLFAEAEADEKKLGANSPLHIIIFDELDAICKQRGSAPSGAGVNDSIVNQLLSKIDGVNALNNILLIGMTNRMDMLDEALLRPGRLEVQIEIGLPDEAGRQQILKIHTTQLRKNKRLADDVDLGYLARVTRNYSGAELAGLIRSAVSYAFARNVNPNDLGTLDTSSILVNMADFQAALDEIKPAFGQSQNLDRYAINGIIPFSSEYVKLEEDLMALTEQVKQSAKSPLVSVLLWGPQGSGKTSLATYIAKKSEYPFVKVISPNDFIGYSEGSKLLAVAKSFDDAYKSDLSIVIVDDIERLLDFTPLGPRFNNNMLQALLVLVKKPPPKQPERRLLIIGITSEPQFIQDSKLASAFQLAYKQPMLRDETALSTCLAQRGGDDLPPAAAAALVQLVAQHAGWKIGVKKFFMALEMARQMCKPHPIDPAVAVQCLRDYGVSL